MQSDRGADSPSGTPLTSRIFDEIYNRYKADIFRVVFHLTGNRAEAEDMFQEVWLRVARQGRLRAAGENLKPWLLTIVFNLHRDALRRKRVRRLFLLRHYRREHPDSSAAEGAAPASTEPDRAAEAARLREDIDRAVSCLPLKQRRVFLLSEVEGVRQTEIAGILEIPVGTVKSLLHRAVKRLQRELDAHNPQREKIKCAVRILNI
jgi:RNA polymerase sigma-70 factor, ECF subfamily